MREELTASEKRASIALTIGILLALWLPIKLGLDYLAALILTLQPRMTPIIEAILNFHSMIMPVQGWFGLALAAPFVLWWWAEAANARAMRRDMGLDMPFDVEDAPAEPSPAPVPLDTDEDYSRASGVDGSLFQTPNVETLARRKKVCRRFGVFFAIVGAAWMVVSFLPQIGMSAQTGPSMHFGIFMGLMGFVGAVALGGGLTFAWWMFVETRRDKKVREMLKEAGADIVVDNVWKTRDGSPAPPPPPPAKKAPGDGWQSRD